ncbi:MAG: transglycosylase family protein [Actinomycetota bacterium]|nr:transglycosylase family protein [Actinomycetota bacterium]
MRPLSEIVPRLAAFCALLASSLLLWAATPLASGADSTPEGLRSRIDASRSQEQSLSSSVGRLSALIARLDRGTAVLARRQSEVQADLDARLAELTRTRASLTRERARAAALRLRLAQSRRVLARRLREMYVAGRPDAITVMLTAHGFTDLLEREEFLGRINRQDKTIIRAVQVARAAAHRTAQRLSRLEVDQRRGAAAVQVQRDALATLSAALTAKRESAARGRAARLAALRSARGGRRTLERELSRLEADQAAANSTAGPSGPWAIPWAIVQCESGGQNLPPNSAGASGYYQFLPTTWRGIGGSGPAAYLASKAEQDRMAAKLWNGGAGASNWDCAAIVGR